MFKNLNTEGMEQQEDRLGGNFSKLPTDSYTGVIKQFYGMKSEGGAEGVVLILDINGQEYRENIYATNKKGENFYTKDGKKYQLPGFITLNDLALCTVGKQLNELEWEEKQVKQMNWETKKEETKAAQVAVELLGEKVTVAIVNTLKNKQEKNAQGVYVDVAGGDREENHIEKVFNTESLLTVREAIDGKEEAEFHPQWVEKNKGQQRDKRSLKDGQTGGNAGAPPKSGGSSSAPPTSTASGLFKKKS